MAKSKANTDKEEKNDALKYNNELFDKEPREDDEIESDGSASAFDETERVGEDNFDDLSEK
jgi:hypothetical protein